MFIAKDNEPKLIGGSEWPLSMYVVDAFIRPYGAGATNWNSRIVLVSYSFRVLRRASTTQFLFGAQAVNFLNQ